MYKRQHLSPRQYLRAIVQRSTLARGDVREPDVLTTSLTWSLRRSPGTVMYVGFSRQRDGGAGAREAFVKLQVDVDEVRALF